MQKNNTALKGSKISFTDFTCCYLLPGNDGWCLHNPNDELAAEVGGRSGQKAQMLHVAPGRSFQRVFHATSRPNFN
jgi:hypothetical protein